MNSTIAETAVTAGEGGLKRMFKTRLLSGIVLVIVLIATVGYGGNILFSCCWQSA